MSQFHLQFTRQCAFGTTMPVPYRIYRCLLMPFLKYRIIEKISSYNIISNIRTKCERYFFLNTTLQLNLDEHIILSLWRNRRLFDHIIYVSTVKENKREREKTNELNIPVLKSTVNSSSSFPFTIV